MKISRTSMAALAAATMVAAGVSSANAATVFGGGINNIIYHNYENVFDSAGHEIVSTPGSPAALAVGETIVGVLRVDLINPTTGSPYVPSSTDEVTGIFAQKVVAIVGNTVYFDKATLTNFSNGGDSFSTGLVGNEMFKFYHQVGAADFNPGIPTSTTMANSVATATNGSVLMSFGFTTSGSPTSYAGDTGYFYSNLGLDNSGNPQVSSFGGLNFITNNTGVSTLPIDDPGESFAAQSHNGTNIFNVDFWLKSSIGLDFKTGTTNLNSPWDFISSDPAQINTFVPVPAAAWTGLSMLGAFGGIAALRRRKAARA